MLQGRAGLPERVLYPLEQPSGVLEQKASGRDFEGYLVSVIVPVYNVVEYLDRCLASIVAQSHANLQVVIVDDGSTDGSGRLCDGWAVRDSRIEVVHQANRGLSAARNVGLDQAMGDYLVFVDSDDYVQERFVEELLAAALGLGVDCAMCGFTWLAGNRMTEALPSAELEVVSGCECLRRLLEQERGDRFHIDTAPWNRIYARSLFEDNGIRYPEGRTYEGTATMFPLTFYSKAVALVPHALYLHRVRPGSIVQTRSESNMIDAFLAGEKLYADVAASCPGLVRIARAKRERLCVASWIAWLDVREGYQPDVAQMMSEALGEEALRNWRDLRLPDDARFLFQLAVGRVSPMAATALRRMWRRMRSVSSRLIARNA